MKLIRYSLASLLCLFLLAFPLFSTAVDSSPSDSLQYYDMYDNIFIDILHKNLPMKDWEKKYLFGLYPRSTSLVYSADGKLEGGDRILNGMPEAVDICRNLASVEKFFNKHFIYGISEYSLIDINYFHSSKKILLFARKSTGEAYVIPFLGEQNEYRGFLNRKIYTAYQFVQAATKQYSYKPFGQQSITDIPGYGVLSDVNIPLRPYLEGIGFQVKWLENEQAIEFFNDEYKFRLSPKGGKQNYGTINKWDEDIQEWKFASFSYYYLKNGISFVPANNLLGLPTWLEGWEFNSLYQTNINFDNLFVETIERPKSHS